MAEEKRIESLHELQILDTDFDSAFDQITKLLETVLQVPIVLVSLVDRNRQWFKSCIGLEISETAREVSFCSDAIKGDHVYIINDASTHPTYCNNPLVTGDPKIRFYAGKPICGPDKSKLGTVCVIDREPRELTEKQLLLLEICSNLVESEIKKMYYFRKLKQNEQNMQSISAIISHDLVNSLSPIISITELLLYDSKDANYIEDLEMIHQSGCNALTLSRDLLDAYKLDLKKLELVKKNTKISQILGVYCDKDNITIENLVESREVCVDRQRIEQIISNLVLNAQDFGTQITIRVEPVDGAIKISVQDNGIGIPKEKRHILFRQFGENIHADVKRRKPRTGLGLFICKELVELHGGKIWLDEEYCDGAKFCFTIPI